jgi:hypothetical protein
MNVIEEELKGSQDQMRAPISASQAEMRATISAD